MRSAVRALGVLMSATAIGLAVPASAASPTPAPSGAAGSAGTQTAAQDVVTFGVQPAGPKGPDARSWLYYSVTPGALLTDWVAIQNYSSRPITLDVYPADASTNSTGEFTLSQQHAALADAGSWITLDLRSSKVTVPPRNAEGAGHVLVRLSMKVPMNAAPGDHGAGVIASLEGIGKNAQGDIIHFNQRVATRVYVRVSGPLHPALSVEGLHATYQGTLNPVGKGVMHLHYVVKNTGNVKLGGRQLVHIQGWWPFGLDYKGLADIPLMLPGGSVAVDATVRGVLPAFLEHVSVDITPLQLASDANPYIPVQKAATYAWAVPWAAIAVVIALVVLGWLAWRARRRPSKGRRARHGSGRGPDDLDPAERVEAVTASSAGGPIVGRVNRAGGRALGVLAAAVVGLAPTAASAGSITVPYNDLASQGSISLCDAAGHAVTSGNIYDKPFVWRAISSQPPVAPYNGKGRTAVLLAYQPRSTAYPDQWNGDTLTGSTQYSDPLHPTAVATALDFSLADYLHEYPTRMGGWVQLRMYLGAPGTSTYTAAYPTADILVSGNTWTLVRGGGTPCSTATAVSNEVAVAKLNVSPTATAAQPNGGSTSEVRSSAGATPSVNPGGASGSGASAQALAQAANPGPVSGGSGAGSGWLIALAIVTAGAVAIYALRRGRA